MTRAGAAATGTDRHTETYAPHEDKGLRLGARGHTCHTTRGVACAPCTRRGDQATSHRTAPSKPLPPENRARAHRDHTQAHQSQRQAASGKRPEARGQRPEARGSASARVLTSMRYILVYCRHYCMHHECATRLGLLSAPSSCRISAATTESSSSSREASSLCASWVGVGVRVSLAVGVRPLRSGLESCSLRQGGRRLAPTTTLEWRHSRAACAGAARPPRWRPRRRRRKMRRRGGIDLEEAREGGRASCAGGAPPGRDCGGDGGV